MVDKIGMLIPVIYLCKVNKKESILRAALALLVKNGVHATPMSAIANAANTGMGTIYNYFSNKEKLINAIYVDIKQHEERVLSLLVSDKPIKLQFEDYYLSVIDFYIQNPLYFQFMEQLQASPMITEESKEEGYRAIEPVINMLKQGQQERIIKDLDIEELLQFLGGTVLSYLRRYFNQTKPGKEKSIRNQLRMTWDGISE